MPTGYTAELMEKGQDFRSFVLTCARAFGACVMQREDPLNEPPKKAEPSAYHDTAMEEASKRLEALKAMNAGDQYVHGATLRQLAVERARRAVERDKEQDARIDAMAAQVRAWEPPSEEHRELKNFMLEQLKISRNGDWSAGRLQEVEKITPEAYFVEALSGAVNSIKYHSEERAKEVNRTNLRNEWIDRLYESLPK